MKYIAFDIGNVLYNINFDDLISKLASTFGISIEEANIFLRDCQKKIDIGFTSFEEEIRNVFKYTGKINYSSVTYLLQAWNNTISPAQDTINYINNNYVNDWQIALLSNIGTEHSKIINQFCATQPAFKNAIKHFSCDLGVRKPSIIYYQSFLQLYPQFIGASYIDDLSINLAAAEKLGLKTFQFNSTIQNNSILKQYLADI